MFEKRYKMLNTAQREAVDAIDGPLMVVAGPGTGKTELLSMRVANILQQTDTLPENILCLTFTESGAAAMRRRLTDIIGQAAYKVAIHTFHSFGSDIIERYGEYFYDNADFRAADELTTYEIIHSLLAELPHSNPLSSVHGGEFVYTKSLMAAMSDFKRSGLTSSELLQIVASNAEIIDKLEPELADVFAGRISNTTVSLLVPTAHTAAELADPPMPAGVTPLNHLLATSLAHAVDEAQANNSTKPITAWRNTWLEKDAYGKFIFTLRRQTNKLQAAIGLYDDYLARLRQRGLYDYDDMILEVLHTLETNNELRYNLQETYLYLMIDEFQDTNLAQSRLLTTLADSPVAEGKPNLMVVGDDDQAIFEFQGADISNVLDFTKRWPSAKRIVLRDNYRSSDMILTSARHVITSIDDRLETTHTDINKALTAHAPTGDRPELMAAPDQTAERQWLANTIKQRIADGTSPSDIAIFARRHSELMGLVPYLLQADIPITYEKRENILDEPIVETIILLCRTVQALAENEHHNANALLPLVVSHPAWTHEPHAIYRLSLAAYQQSKQWLEVMQADETFQACASWLLSLVEIAQHQPLEQLIDAIIAEPTKENNTPFHDYYFGKDAQQATPSYIAAIEAVRGLRDRIRSHFATETPSVTELLELIDLYETSETQITRVSQQGNEDAVHIMSAHKSKGLEFPHVYIVGATDNMWGEKARAMAQKITYPANLALARAGSTIGERTRLFFVAMTRAKQSLTISYSIVNSNGKTQLPASFLAEAELDAHDIVLDTADTQQAAITDWYAPLVTPPHDGLRDALQTTLSNYKLSPTHLGTYLDVAQNGPAQFLLYNLLRFPSAIAPPAAFGSAMHSTLQRAHGHFAQHGAMRALEDSLHDFSEQLASKHLDPDSLAQWRSRGNEALQAFLPYCETNVFQIGQKAELGFAHQQAVIDVAHLTGQLDLVSINKKTKTIEIYDYKTGKPAGSWKGKDEYEKIKLHKYRQQLIFYQLLVEASRDYHDYNVTGLHLLFVEPDQSSREIVQLSHAASTEELAELRELVQAVHYAITALYLPDTSEYPASLKGVQTFERDMVEWYRKNVDATS